MILSCVIYLTYSLHDKNIPEVISGQDQAMSRSDVSKV